MVRYLINLLILTIFLALTSCPLTQVPWPASPQQNITTANLSKCLKYSIISENSEFNYSKVFLSQQLAPAYSAHLVLDSNYTDDPTHQQLSIGRAARAAPCGFMLVVADKGLLRHFKFLV